MAVDGWHAAKGGDSRRRRLPDGGEPAVLVGHSLGGNIVRVYAARWPAAVAGLVLVEASAPGLVLWPGHNEGHRDGEHPRAARIDPQTGAGEITRLQLRVPAIVLTRTPGRWSSPEATAEVDRGLASATRTARPRAGRAAYDRARRRPPADRGGAAIDRVRRRPGGVRPRATGCSTRPCSVGPAAAWPASAPTVVMNNTHEVMRVVHNRSPEPMMGRSATVGPFSIDYRTPRSAPAERQAAADVRGAATRGAGIVCSTIERAGVRKRGTKGGTERDWTGTAPDR